MEKLVALSWRQEARIPEWEEKWVKIGLSTEPADFDKAIAAAKKAYSLCGLDQPLVILKVGSPYAAMISGGASYEILKELLPTKTGEVSNINNPTDLSVGHPINSKVWSKIRDQIWDAVSSQVSSLVESPIMDQVSNTVGHHVNIKIGNQIGRQVRGQVRRQINSQAMKQVNSSVRSQVSSQVQYLVWKQIREQVAGDVRNRVANDVGNQIHLQISDNVSSQVKNSVKSQVKETNIAFINEGVSSMWCSYTSYFTFFRDVCGLEMPADTVEKMNVNEDLVTSCGGTWWHENILVVSDRPRKISLDAEGRLHCENGPSVEYRDGWSLYNWHGVSVPEEWVTTKKPTAKEALTWENIEQRRAACEIIGWANVLKELDAKIIDEDGDPEIGTLVECTIPDSGKERFLRVLCGTSREFVIPVPRVMKTALEANSWTWGLSPNEYKPEVRT